MVVMQSDTWSFSIEKIWLSQQPDSDCCGDLCNSAQIRVHDAKSACPEPYATSNHLNAARCAVLMQDATMDMTVGSPSPSSMLRL
eukprot:1159493-Pelagomonas_calceolata.AAC.7